MALVLGLAGLGYRAALVALDVPGSNSDEATFGLVAIHIAAGRDFPVFLYGQHYMGTLESYLAAPLFVLFEPTWALLRTPLLLLYAAFVYLMYRLTRRLYSPWLAVLTVGLLALGSERVVRDQMTAVGGRPEVKLAVVALLLLAVALGQGRGRHPWLAFSAFGLLAGLALWNDWLVLPYLAVAVVVLLVGCHRRLLGRAGLLVLLGFLIGLAPLVADNLTAPPGQDSLSVFRQLSHGESEPAALPDRVRGAVLTGIPLAHGVCRPDGCRSWQGWWGPFYLLLLLVAAVLAVLGLLRPGTPAAGAGEPDAGSAVARRIGYVAQLALVVGAALTVAGYARNALAATAPLASARYLSTLQISLPAALWPLWVTARAAWRRAPRTPVGGRAVARRTGRVAGGGATVLLAATVAAMIYTTAVLVKHVGEIRAEEAEARALATAVRRAGIRDTYAEYWTCNRLIFYTNERVVCAVLGERLRFGQNRYDPYPERVNAAADPAFIFTVGEAADTAFREHLRERGVAARVTDVGPYRIYQPDRPVRPWQR